MTNAAPQPSPREIAHDALRELMNIGTGNALTALSKLLGGQRLQTGVPEVELVADEAQAAQLMKRYGAPAHGAKLSVAVVSRDRARLSYRFAVLLDDGAANVLPSLLLHEAESSGSPDTLEQSALAELGNILASAFLNAASAVLGSNLMPSPPAVNVGDLGPLMAREVRGHSDDKPMVVMQSRFECADREFDGQMLLCLEMASALAVLEQMGIRSTGL